MRILEAPRRAIIGEFTIKDLNFGFGMYIFPKNLIMFYGILINPKHFKIQILKFLNNIINLIVPQLIIHQRQRNRIGWKLQMIEFG